MLITKQNLPIPNPTILQSVSELVELLDNVGPNWIDFETTGLDMLAEDFRVVGIGLANSKAPEGVYAAINPEDYTTLVNTLYTHNLIAYNVGYDAKVLHRMSLDIGVEPTAWPWVGDTMVLYKLLDNRGYKGQNWSLKTAQMEVLGWPHTNEVDLDKWLIANGYFRNNKGKQIPTKGEMWRAPVDILGRYCGLDAASTMQLDIALSTMASPFTELMAMYEREFNVLAELVNEQFWGGLYIDHPGLTGYLNDLQGRIDQTEHTFLYDSVATPFINEFNAANHQEVLDSEPPMYTQKGVVTKRYEKWQDKAAASEDTMYFNASSKKQLQWLFYDRLYQLDSIGFKTDWKGNNITQFNTATKKAWNLYTASVVDNEGTIVTTVEGKAYPGDEPNFSIDKSVLPHLGEPGNLLTQYNKLIKERGYVQSMLDSITSDDPYHNVSLKVHGTVTGRCSGGSPTHSVNIQQIPKSRGYLQCLQAAPGNVLVQADFTALEPVVLTELSKDKTMWSVYGTDVVDDIYLKVGSGLGPLKEGLTAHGYDPEAPTVEAIKATKKAAKGLRGIAKILHLSASYGAGAFTVWKTLTNQGVTVLLSEVKQMLKDYWKLFSGVKEYESKLKAEWKANNGWFLNGRNRPMSVPLKYEKDILNRSIQSTGHDNLATMLVYLHRLRKERQLDFRFVMCDFHDEFIAECKEGNQDKVVQLIADALELTNKELGGCIALQCPPEVCTSFDVFKCE